MPPVRTDDAARGGDSSTARSLCFRITGNLEDPHELMWVDERPLKCSAERPVSSDRRRDERGRGSCETTPRAGPTSSHPQFQSFAMVEQPSQSGKKAEHPPGGLTTAFIAVFVVFLAAMPATYYLGNDRFDERFAWRMFSSVRLTNCDATARETPVDGAPREFDIYRDVQIAWYKLIQRNRDAVVRAYLRRRCEDRTIDAARIRTVCRAPDGSKSRHVWSIDCDDRSIDRKDEAIDG